MPDSPTRPTPERLSHASMVEHVVISDPSVNVVTVRINDWLLDRLHHRKPPAINVDQYGAGLRFYEDWYYSSPSSSSTFDRTIVDGAKYFTDTERMIISKLRYERALRSLGRRHRQILHACLIMEESLESFGRRSYRYQDIKNARMVALCCLRDALDALVDHYRGRRSPRVP